VPVGSADFTEEAERLGVRALRMLVDASHSGLTAIAELVEAGKLRPVIAGTFPLAEAAEAHRLGETGRTSGKLVLLTD
jgi:NADPH:quinone reductase-like Zn-dependent oxidoreductase